MPLSLQRFFYVLALAVPFSLIFSRAVADALTVVVASGFLLQSFIRRDFSWLRLPWVRALLVVWVYLLVCGAFSMYDVHTGIMRGLQWIRFPLFAMAFGLWLLPLDTDYKWLRCSMVVVLGLVAFDTLFQFFHGTSLTGNPTSSYAQRLTGPFGDRAVVGVYLTRLALPVFGLLFMYGVQQTDKVKRYLLPALFVVIISLTILLSGERMAFGLYAGCAFLFWLGTKGPLRKALFVIGVVIALTVGSLIAFLPRMHDRFITTTAPVIQDFSHSTYGVIFENAMQAWKLAPVMGVGPKNFYAACMAGGKAGGFQAASPWESDFNCSRHPHNIYLEWLAETGLIGLGLFCWLIWGWGRHAWQNLRSTPLPHYYAVLGFAIGLVPFLWPFMTSMSFFINWSAILFWWVLGLGYSLPQKQA